MGKIHISSAESYGLQNCCRLQSSMSFSFYGSIPHLDMCVLSCMAYNSFVAHSDEKLAGAGTTVPPAFISLHTQDITAQPLAKNKHATHFQRHGYPRHRRATFGNMVHRQWLRPDARRMRVLLEIAQISPMVTNPDLCQLLLALLRLVCARLDAATRCDDARRAS